MPIRAVIYIRVSTEDQGSNYSPDSQRDACRKYAEQHGFTVVGEYFDMESGAELSRTEFNKIKRLTDIQALIVYTQDRFGRAEELDTWNLIADFENRGVQVHCSDTGYIDIHDFGGQLNMLLRAKVAREERAKIQERTQRGRKERCAKGKKVIITTSAPYGYDYDKVNGVLVINDEQARIVSMIYDWYVYGDETGKRLGGNAIASKLSEMRVPTKHDIDHRRKVKRGYGIWNYAGVMRILRRETYAGVWYYNHHTHTKKDIPSRAKDRSEWIGVPCPPIVSRELWDMAQQVGKDNICRNMRNTKHEYLMRGRMNCATCGSSMRTRKVETAKGGTFFYYQCRGMERWHSHDGNTITCKGNLPRDVIDGVVWNAITDVLRNPARMIETIEAEHAELEKQLQPDRDYKNRCEAKLSKLQDRSKRLLELYLDGKYEKEELDSEKAAIDHEADALKRKIAELDQRINDTHNQVPDVAQIRQFCQERSAGLDYYTFEDKQFTLDALNVKAIVNRDEMMIHITGYFPSIDVSFSIQSSQRPPVA